MFDEIGKKIKKLVIFQTVLSGILLFIISLFLGITLGKSLFWIAIIFFVFGGIFIWLSSFILYAYGELVDTTTEIKKELGQVKNLAQKELLYDYAMALIEKNEYKLAYNTLRKIGDYKDAEKQLDYIISKSVDALKRD